MRLRRTICWTRLPSFRHFGGFAVALLFGAVTACGADGADTTEATDDELLQELPLSIDESALDRAVSPCDDFYAFACGGYIEKNPPDWELASFSRAFGSVSTANAAVFDQIVAEAKKNPKTETDVRLARFHGSCMATSTGGGPGAAKELAVARAAADELGRLFAQRGLGAALGELSLRTNRLPFVSVNAFIDSEHDASKVALHVHPPSASRLEHDEAKLKAKLAPLYPGETEEARTARARTILAINRALGDALASDDKGTHPIGREGLARVMPHLDWSDFFDRIGLANAERVNVLQIDALQKIDAVIASLTAADLATYIDYHDLREIDIALPEDIDEDIAKSSCDFAISVFAPGLMQERFVETVVGRKNDRQARALARRVIATFEQRLESADWLDPATKAEAVNKIRKMVLTPLFQSVDRFDDTTFSPDSYVTNWAAMMRHIRRADYALVDKPTPRTELDGGLTANAFYSPAENRIQLNPGLLHGSFFGPQAGHVLNFGALGWIVGHEVTHGFDDSGRHFDAIGTARDWWAPATAASFVEKSKCFVDSYDAVEVAEAIDPTTKKPAHVKGEQTLGENIADHGGLRVAYDAAKKFMATTKTVAGFSPEQQFFVAGAQTWCESLGSETALNQVNDDVHSPAKARVNVSMAHFDRFAEAFQCAPGSKMVAPKACKIW